MSDASSGTTAESTAWTEEPREGPSLLSALVESSRSIVPPAWRSEFLAERWIAGRPCVVQPSICSTGLLVDVQFSNLHYEFTARYYYEDPEDALLALRDWDGRADPPGPWIKEAVTNRMGPGAFEESDLPR